MKNAKTFIAFCLSLSIFSLISIPASSTPAEQVTLTITCGSASVGLEYELCKEGVARWSAKTGHEVKLAQTPESSTDRLIMYQQVLYEMHNTIDVLMIDIVWPGLLQKYLVDLSNYDIDTGEHLPVLIENNSVNGKLVALPWFGDVGLLYYRKDLLEAHNLPVPSTWEELNATAAFVQSSMRSQGNKDFWGYVWQGDAYEGLTCNVVEWIASRNAGSIIESNRNVSINSSAAINALQTASDWIGTISPDDVLNFREEDARTAFQEGQALFMRNWPYAWKLLQSEDSAVRNKIGIAPLPAGAKGRHAGTLGGWQLAVSKYSENQALAVDLVRYLTGPEEQKIRLETAGYLPTRPALYKDPEIHKNSPHLADIFASLEKGVTRPSSAAGRAYKHVSRNIFTRVAMTLRGEMEPKAAILELEEYIKRRVR